MAIAAAEAEVHSASGDIEKIAAQVVLQKTGFSAEIVV